MDKEKLYNDDDFKEQDERAKESLRKLDSFLNTSHEENVQNSHDYLDELEEEDDVKIEDLRNLINQLEEMKKEYEVPESHEQSQGQSQSQGKVLTKKLPGVKTSEPEYDNTAKEIAQSFINCFILCLVTALMGTGWFLYIINHI